MTDDPLFVLREYRQLAPWRLKDLSTVAAAILEASGVKPVNAAAASRPSERTIRFYVTRRVVSPPDGRGTAAIYGYRHLLQVLAVKLKQMEGATLAAIRDDLERTTGDVLERRVAGALGPRMPTPSQLPLMQDDEQPRGRAGQILHTRPEPSDYPPGSSKWRRLTVADGIELHVRDDHPLVHAGLADRKIADAFRLTAQRLVAAPPPAAAPTRPARSPTAVS